MLCSGEIGANDYGLPRRGQPRYIAKVSRNGRQNLWLPLTSSDPVKKSWAVKKLRGRSSARTMTSRGRKRAHRQRAHHGPFMGGPFMDGPFMGDLMWPLVHVTLLPQGPFHNSKEHCHLLLYLLSFNLLYFLMRKSPQFSYFVPRWEKFCFDENYFFFSRAPTFSWYIC